jgi:hypothetical protein
MNLIVNNLVTTEDIEIAEEIFGPDVGSLKGKTTRMKPNPVVNNYIDIPQELMLKQQNIVFCIDSIKVNGLLFLTTISKNVCYWTAQYIESKTFQFYQEFDVKMFCHFSGTCFTIQFQVHGACVVFIHHVVTDLVSLSFDESFCPELVKNLSSAATILLLVELLELAFCFVEFKIIAVLPSVIIALV